MSKKKNKQEKDIEKDATAKTANPIEEQETTPQEEKQENAATEEETSPTAELENQIAELKDKYLRQVAEFDNYRKRTLKEKTELILNGGENIIKSLLPVIDDIERAKKNMETADNVEALREGVDLVFKKLITTLENAGLKKIDTEGKDFNTDEHEAIAMIPAPSDEAKGKVIDCVQPGYKLNDKVIRHAKVAIGQ